MQHLLHTAQPGWTHCLYDLSAYGQLDLPAYDCQLAFEVDILLHDCPEHVYFGLVSIDPANQSPRAGFAVRLDLERGEVWDVLNGFGLLASLEQDLRRADSASEDDSLLLSLRVNKCGNNLLPDLRIGGERVLYPAICARSCQRLSAITGAFQPGRDAAPFCQFPALWMSATVA